MTNRQLQPQLSSPLHCCIHYDLSYCITHSSTCTSKQPHQIPNSLISINHAKGRQQKVPATPGQEGEQEGQQCHQHCICRIRRQPCIRPIVQQGSRSAYFEESLGRPGYRRQGTALPSHRLGARESISFASSGLLSSGSGSKSLHSSPPAYNPILYLMLGLLAPYRHRPGNWSRYRKLDCQDLGEMQKGCCRRDGSSSRCRVDQACARNVRFRSTYVSYRNVRSRDAAMEI